MRCKNCGWPNKPAETNCVKCGSPLSADEDTFDSRPVDEPRQYPGTSPARESVLNKTVMETDIFGTGNGNSSRYEDNGNGGSGASNFGNATRLTTDDDSTTPSVCPKCGYPLRPGATVCPNCKFGVGDNASQPARREQTQTKSAASQSERATRINGSNATAKGGYRGTVNPYMMQVDIEPSFALKPVKRVGERHDPAEVEFEGSEVTLNRDNTEPANQSITSREQAVITNVDGQWYIEDKSEQKTTFVQASRRLELQDGDIILLGNRLFQFKL